MVTAALLAGIHSVEDLPLLALELGFEPAWSPLSLEVLRVEGISTPARIVGRRLGFVAFAVQVPGAMAGARALARAMAKRATPVLVLALDPVERHLAIAAAAADCPVALIRLDRPRKLDLRILERSAAITETSPLARCLAWADALGGRSIGDRFYREFRGALDAATASLPSRIPPADRHAMALLAFTRVLFLYFLQERGWLDGRPRFLREELDRALDGGRGVETTLLRPLFFGTLNRPPAGRTAAARRFGRIPFLNGGLFDPHRLERRWRDPLPDAIWAMAFDRVFERYHFTIAEPGSAEAAIGPEVLGRVFERVMDPEERRVSGSFYTPPALVDEVVGETLRHWLAGALGCSAVQADAHWTDPSPPALSLIRRVTILDPAVGSGAFLLGALTRLVRARVAAGEARHTATRDVIARNLFGVDNNPSAVHLAELRLWLEVIEAEPALDPLAIEPLPNLEGLIRQGDSVLEPVDLPFAAQVLVGRSAAREREQLVRTTGRAKRAAVRALARTEVRAAEEGFGAAIAGVERQIAALAEGARAPTLFGDRIPLSRTRRNSLRNLRLELRRLRRYRRQLASAGQVPWFHYATHFPDVFGRGGFDVVLGNPPWVRAEALPRGDRAVLKRRFRWFGGTGGRGFRPLADLSMVFTERALELLRPGGVLGFVLPAKVRTAQYATVAREDLSRRTTLHAVVDRSRSAHDFDATVYPLVLVATRHPPPPGHEVAIGPPGSAATTRQANLGAAPWTLSAAGAPRPELARFPTVGDRFRIRLGIKTGADEILINPDQPLEPEVLRPAIRGRDIGPAGLEGGCNLLVAYDDRGAPLGRLPGAAARYVAAHERILRARADYRGGPLWTLFRTEALTARHLVVWPDLSRALQAVVLSGPARPVPLNTCYWIGTKSRREALRLAAWLNTRPVRELAFARATAASAGYARYNAATVGSLPLPDDVLRNDEFARLSEATPAGEEDRAALDRLAAEFLGS